MWRPVSQNHVGRLIDAGGDGIDGGFDIDDRDAFPNAFGFAANALNTAHGPQHHDNPQNSPAVLRQGRHGRGTAHQAASESDLNADGRAATDSKILCGRLSRSGQLKKYLKYFQRRETFI